VDPVLVVGPGALGVLVAARLHAAGTPTLLACRTEEAAAHLAASGLEATDERGAVLRATVPTVAHPGDVPAQARALVLATKCADAAPALRHWLTAVRPDAPVVTLQNGVLGDKLGAIAGARHVECTVSLPATLLGPGMSVQTGAGHLVLGPWPRGAPSQAVRSAATLLAPAAPVSVSANMLGVKWSKLLINSCISTLGVAAGEQLARLLEDRRARAAFLAIGRRQGRHKSSSLQSLERGQRTEVEFLNGHIVATAREHGLEAPVNAALVELVHRIEEGMLRPDPANLDRLPL
jgi:2-dehydropantoate 2-reductase